MYLDTKDSKLDKDKFLVFRQKLLSIPFHHIHDMYYNDQNTYNLVVMSNIYRFRCILDIFLHVSFQIGYIAILIYNLIV